MACKWGGREPKWGRKDTVSQKAVVVVSARDGNIQDQNDGDKRWIEMGTVNYFQEIIHPGLSDRIWRVKKLITSFVE